MKYVLGWGFVLLMTYRILRQGTTYPKEPKWLGETQSLTSMYQLTVQEGPHLLDQYTQYLGRRYKV